MIVYNNDLIMQFILKIFYLIIVRIISMQSWLSDFTLPLLHKMFILACYIVNEKDEPITHR